MRDGAIPSPYPLFFSYRKFRKNFLYEKSPSGRVRTHTSGKLLLSNSARRGTKDALANNLVARVRETHFCSR